VCFCLSDYASRAKLYLPSGACSHPFDERRKVDFQQHIGRIHQEAAISSRRLGSHASAVDGNEAGPCQAQPLRPVCVVCRRGNDSQYVVQMLKQSGISSAKDLVGGLEAWSKQADVDFPEY
jgi:adenylyltransferase/sulfurtransferase